MPHVPSFTVRRRIYEEKKKENVARPTQSPTHTQKKHNNKNKVKLNKK